MTHAALATDPDATPRPALPVAPGGAGAARAGARHAPADRGAPLAGKFSSPAAAVRTRTRYVVGDLDGAKEHVLDTATAAYHACGSVAMLPRDKGGVADPPPSHCLRYREPPCRRTPVCFPLFC